VKCKQNISSFTLLFPKICLFFLPEHSFGHQIYKGATCTIFRNLLRRVSTVRTDNSKRV